MLTALVTLTAITAIVCIVMLAVLLNRPPDAPSFQSLDVWEAAIRETVAAELALCRDEVRTTSYDLRQDLTAAIDSLGRTLGSACENVANADREHLDRMHDELEASRQSVAALMQSFDARLAKLQETLDASRNPDRH